MASTTHCSGDHDAETAAGLWRPRRAIVGLPLFGLTVAMAGQPPLKYGVLIGYLTLLLGCTDGDAVLGGK